MADIYDVITKNDLKAIENLNASRLLDFCWQYDSEISSVMLDGLAARVMILVKIADHLEIGMSEVIKKAQTHFLSLAYFQSKIKQENIKQIIAFFKSKGDIRKVPKQDAYIHDRFSKCVKHVSLLFDGSNIHEFIAEVWDEYIDARYLDESNRKYKERYFIEMLDFIKNNAE